MSDDTCRSSAARGNIAHDIRELGMIVTINLSHAPAKALPLFSEGFEFKRGRDRIKTLDLVVVDDHDQIVQGMMAGKQNGFPIRAFITFAIAHQHENTMLLFIELAG